MDEIKKTNENMSISSDAAASGLESDAAATNSDAAAATNSDAAATNSDISTDTANTVEDAIAVGSAVAAAVATTEPEKSKGAKAWGIISTILVIAIVVLAVALVGARLFGLNVYTVVSGSMEPTYKVGDLIYVKSVPAESIEVGDPITFVLNDDLVVATHRVVRIDTEAQHFYTKGDNNEVEDVNPVHFKNLIGKPVFRIPLLGYLSNWVQQPPGLYIAIAIVIALLGLVFIPGLFRRAKEEEKQTQKQ